MLVVHYSGGGKSGSRHSLRLELNILESILDDGGNESAQEGTRQFETWVSVDLNKARFVIFINHEIHSQQLKIILSAFLIQREVSGSDSILS